MALKTGMVMEIKNNNAFLMTPDGEFVRVKIKGRNPEIGEEYTGKTVSGIPTYRNMVIAASVAFMFLIGTGAYAYTTPVSSVVLDINPSIKLDLNRWDIIIKTTPLNDDGKKLLESVNVKNKSLDSGLNTIIDEAKKQNIITDDYKKSVREDTKNGKEEKKITVLIDSNKKDPSSDLKKFEEHVNNDDLKLEVKKEKFSPETLKSNKTNNGNSLKGNDKKNNGSKNDNASKDKGNSKGDKNNKNDLKDKNDKTNNGKGNGSSKK
jgi:hypothetical protein